MRDPPPPPGVPLIIGVRRVFMAWLTSQNNRRDTLDSDRRRPEPLRGRNSSGHRSLGAVVNELGDLSLPWAHRKSRRESVLLGCDSITGSHFISV